MSWTDFAACQDLDPELFFPVTETGAGAAQVERAKAVCARCPVRRQCLDAALEAHAVGVWGGTTETERRDMRRAAVSTGAASGDDARAPRPHHERNAMNKADRAEFARRVVTQSRATLSALSSTLRTEAAMRLLHVAGVIAPKGTATEAKGGDATGGGEMVGRPSARLIVVTHDPIAGAVLTMGIAKVMAQQLNDLHDLAWMYSEPEAADPHA